MMAEIWRTTIIAIATIISVTSSMSQTTFQLSQNSNFYIETVSTKQTFISSIEGLNVVDGLHTKVYKPSTHNMFGKNIQSDFYEDSNGLIWFCTYKAIHAYDPIEDDFEYYFLDNANGVEIRSDYRIVDHYNNELWIHIGNELHIWNTSTKETEHIYDTPCASIESSIINKSKNSVVLLCPIGVYAIKINPEESTHSYKNITNEYCTSAIYTSDNSYILGTAKGEMLFQKDLNGNPTKIIKAAYSQINRISQYGSTGDLVVSSQDKILHYDASEDVLSPIDNSFIDCQTQESTVYNFMEINDGISWISRDGIGVTCSSDQKKFTHKLQQSDLTYPSVIGFFELTDKVIVITRSNGIFTTDLSGDILSHKIKSDQDLSLPIIAAVQESPTSILLTLTDGICRYDVANSSIMKLQNVSTYQPNYIPALVQVGQGEFVCSTYDSLLYRLLVTEENYSFKAIDHLSLNTPMTTLLQKVDSTTLLVSANEDEIIRVQKNGSSYEIVRKYNIPDGVNFFNMENDTLGYLGNSNGLFEYNSIEDTFVRILDDRNFLAYTIYFASPDAEGNLWCSSNSGIIKYDPRTNSAYKFTKRDGVQSMEFNTNAHLVLEDGSFFIGGVNGFNVFHPDSIRLSKSPAPVIITDYRINDTTSRKLGVPTFIDNIQVPYQENTLSFLFHAVDYSNPQATRVKSMLIGEDDTYVQSVNAQAEVRYANLSPGKYTLSLIGANVDGVWNIEDRTIDIEVLPPFWQTWWFRLLSTVALSSLIYYGFRLYYKQQLAKKDFQLREQALIIEKQSALQSERTRIAGEMHDDLGGGLTTIKFLSQKLHRKIDDDGQKIQLQKIVTQSKTLVSNMSEIIWAMNAGFDTLDNLIAYTRRYSSEYLEDYDLDLSFRSEGDTRDITISGEKRRNIFLVIKEALHNSVKHSGADTIKIRFNVLENPMSISISDNGVGLPDDIRINGNGIKSMKTRIENMGGTIAFQHDDGLLINIAVNLG